MGLTFTYRDFAYPISILSLKREFDHNQWLDENELQARQFQHLQLILQQAYNHCRYYRNSFKQCGAAPTDFSSPEDLQNLPILTRHELIRFQDQLLADNARSFRPQQLSTSGTSGTCISLYVDKPSNVQEFVYYWRYFGWAGYSLGDTFAELSIEHFTTSPQMSQRIYHFHKLSRRLLLNSLHLSKSHIADFIAALRRYKPGFLKGLPSNLYVLALLCREHGVSDITFKAVFSQGEQLPHKYRILIEDTFSCSVRDSYGHIERTAAISQCPHGSYHTHPDYGLIELLPIKIDALEPTGPDTFYAEIIGTSLHNMAMPLIRYQTGDIVEVDKDPAACPCGRNFPAIRRIFGRRSDAIITPDKRALTGLYVVFDRIPGILMGQLVQDSIDTLTVRYASMPADVKQVEALLRKQLAIICGREMTIEFCRCSVDDVRGSSKLKFKNVSSTVPTELILD